MIVIFGRVPFINRGHQMNARVAIYYLYNKNDRTDLKKLIIKKG